MQPLLPRDGRTQSDFVRTANGLSSLQNLMGRRDRSLVVFVGAGVSCTPGTGMPSTPLLISAVLEAALRRSGKGTIEPAALSKLIGAVAQVIGFEVTLNDLLQICPQAVSAFFRDLSEFEKQCRPNRAHAMLACWLASGGTVITTNYDTLIERAVNRRSRPLAVRDGSAGRSFERWRDDLKAGGTLFKLHGSLADENSCLGALTHVGTRMDGFRASLLECVVSERPICFLGWRGSDPDIPPVLGDLWHAGLFARPLHWVHWQGPEESSRSIAKGVAEAAQVLHETADVGGMLGEADELGNLALGWLGRKPPPSPVVETIVPQLPLVFRDCPASGAARLVGIALRRGLASDGRGFTEALAVLELAKARALEESDSTAAAAAAQEIAHLYWSARGGAGQPLAFGQLKVVFGTTSKEDDPSRRVGPSFGLLSMTIVRARRRPWLLLSLPRLFRRYDADIAALERAQPNSPSVAVHQSLRNLYAGRLRMFLPRTLVRNVPALGRWQMEPFDRARARISAAGDSDPHARVDVLAYRCVALARCGRTSELPSSIEETEWHCKLLGNTARLEHWKEQKQQIARLVKIGHGT